MLGATTKVTMKATATPRDTNPGQSRREMAVVDTPDLPSLQLSTQGTQPVRGTPLRDDRAGGTVNGSSFPDEVGQRIGQRFRGFLGDVVSGVDAVASHVGSPVAPDHERVAVQLFQAVLQ